MIKHNLKTAWRNLRINKLFTVLNITGLALGLAVAMLLSLFIIQEYSSNPFPNRDKIFRYIAHISYDGNQETWAGVPSIISPTVVDNLPEVKYSARTLLNGFGENASVRVGEDTYIEGRLYWADPDIIDVFGLQLLHGDPNTALGDPNNVLLSERKAKQYFGEENPVGQTIEMDRSTTLHVTGVYADLPITSTFDAELIAAFSSTYYAQNMTWDNASFETWIMLNDAHDRRKVEDYLSQILQEQFGEEGTYYTLSLQSLADVHLHSADINTYSDRKGDANQLRQLTYLAIALLLIAAINYMNLATARARQRSKEVGVSKTLGASQKGLLGKFYAETALLTLIAIIFGVILTVLGIPIFNNLSGKHLVYETLHHPVFIIGLPLLWLVLTSVSGLYPAVVLSSYTPLAVLQKGRGAQSGSAVFHQSLVVLQFAASIVLIVGVAVMYRQMDFMSQHKLGYNPENVLAISLGPLKNRQELDALRNEIGALALTKSMAVSQAFPGKGESSHTLRKDESDKQGIMFRASRVSGDIEDVLELDLLAGRMPNERQERDTTAEGGWVFEMVLNKYAVDYLGLTPEEAIGKKPLAGVGDHTYVVGVVDDFNYTSLHNAMGGYAFMNASFGASRYLLVRFATGDLRVALQQYERAFKTVVPDASFDYTFLDSHLKSLYLADRRTASVLLVFSIMAIFVGCLGLFGLAAFTAEKRTKEIGVRKVLGATVTSLVNLLSVDFIKLVVVAFVIACPIAYWAFSSWLDNFAYRIDIQWWMFAVAGMVAVVIALLTVATQAIRAAVANPVDSLRDE